MIEQAGRLKEELDGLGQKIASLDRKGSEYRSAARRIKVLTPIAELYGEYCRLREEADEAEEILDDKDSGELAELAREEILKLSPRMDLVRDKISGMLEELAAGGDSAGVKGVIVEIRAGTGGDEAALFAKDLFNMYFHYAEEKGWLLEVINCHESEMGGVKEIIFGLEGDRVWELMRQEGGVHRVQRIPLTESSGRIHTSTVTVAVLPETGEEEVKVEPKDLRVDTYRSSGAGGQHVNVTDSAVRLTHIPTGIVVQCQDERSQHKNRAKAMRVLHARLSELYMRKKEEETARDRSQQVKTGDRSQKIRTYNYPQNRVTDHRVNLTLHKLDSIMKGGIDHLLEALAKQDVPA